MKEIEIYNRITLNINKAMLDYLTMVVQQNLEDDYVEDDEVYKEMIEDLYSILITRKIKQF
tara:strand:- start:140 stop:322 length:183 start_codon:yes stop_codon:yes gene_type:complete